MNPYPSHIAYAVIAVCTTLATALAAATLLGGPAGDTSGQGWGKSIPHAFPASR